MRALVLVLVVGCGSESGGGGNFNQPEDWYTSTVDMGPLVFDETTTNYEVTLEGGIALTRSQRIGTTEITGLTVIGEITEQGTGAKIRVDVAPVGQAPGPYGSKLAQGPYTYGHADPVVLDPVSGCYTPPCAATDRYTVTFDAVENPGRVELVWHATLHVLLANTEGDDIYPPEDDERLTLVIVE